MQKVLHPRDDVDRLYISRKDGGRGLAALKTALTHRYNDSKTIYKNTKEDSLQPPDTKLRTR